MSTQQTYLTSSALLLIVLGACRLWGGPVEESQPFAPLSPTDYVPPRTYKTPYLDPQSGLLYAVYRSFNSVPCEVDLLRLENPDALFSAIGTNDANGTEFDSYTTKFRGRTLTADDLDVSKKQNRRVSIKRGEGIACAIPIWNTCFWDELVQQSLASVPKRLFIFTVLGSLTVVENGKVKFSQHPTNTCDELSVSGMVLSQLRKRAPAKRTVGDTHAGMTGRYAVTPLLDEKRGDLVMVVRSLSDATLRIHMKSVECIREAWRLADGKELQEAVPASPEPGPAPEENDPLDRVVDLRLGEGIVGSVRIWETPLWKEMIEGGKPRQDRYTLTACPAIYTADDKGHPVPDREDPSPLVESLSLDTATLSRLEALRQQREGQNDKPAGR